MQQTWIVAGIIILAGAAIGISLSFGDEPAPELQEGDRIAYNVTLDERTWTYVGEVLGLTDYVAPDGGLEQAFTIRWQRSDAYLTAHYQDGVTVATQSLHDDEGSHVYRDPYLPYDETSEYASRHQSIRFPDEPACIMTDAPACYLTPLQRIVGDENPVRIERDPAFPVATNISWADGHATLVGYEPGGLVELLPSPVPIPAPQVRPATPRPPADIEMAFTLDEAIQTARLDPTFFYFQEWLAAHPDHYIAAGVYDAFTPGGYTGVRTNDHHWTLLFTDGVEEYMVPVVKRTLETPGGALAAPASGQLLYIGQRGGYETHWPAADAVPPMPAWSDLVATAEAHAMEGMAGLPVRAWEFVLDCDEACAEPTWQIAGVLGRDDYHLNPTVNTLVIPDVDWAFLEFRFDGEGHLQRLTASQQTGSHFVSIGEPAPVAGHEAGPPKDDAVAMAVPAGAAGIGLLLLIKFLAPLFSRVRPDALLQHPVRRRIADTVEAEPGIHLGDLERRLELASSTARHHVRKMVEGERLQSRRMGRYTCLFPPGPLRGDVVAEAGVTRSEGARQVMEALRANPGSGVRDLAGITGLNASTISYHARRLEEAGSVIAKRDGRVKRLRLA